MAKRCALSLVAGGFVRQIDTRPRVGAILAFLRHDTGIPDFPFHLDKPGAPAYVPSRLKS